MDTKISNKDKIYNNREGTTKVPSLIIMKKLELYLLVLGIILCGIVIDRYVYDNITIRYLIWSVLTLVLFTSLAIRKADFGVLRRYIFPAFLCYLIATCISLFYAINVMEGWYEVAKISMMFVYLACAAVILKDIKDIAKPLVVLLIVLSLYGILPKNPSIILPSVGATVFAGTMGNKNLLAQALVLLIPFSLYAIFEIKRWWGLVGLISISLAGYMMWICKTRSAWLALFVSVLVLSMFSRKAFLATLILIILVTSIGVCIAPSETVATAISWTSLQERLSLWKASVGTSISGAGNWKIIMPERLSEIARFGFNYSRPHNDFVWVWAETGLAGLLFYISIFGLAFWYARHNPLVLMGLCAYAIIAFFSFPKERCFHSMILMVLMGLVIKDTRHCFVLPKKVTIPIAVVLVLSIGIFYCHYMTQRCVIRVNSAKVAKDWPKVINEITKCKTRFVATLDPTGVPVIWSRGEANLILGNEQECYNDFKKAEQHNPNDFYVVSSLGACNIFMQDYKEAERYYTKAVKIYPDNEVMKKNLITVRELCQYSKQTY